MDKENVPKGAEKLGHLPLLVDRKGCNCFGNYLGITYIYINLLYKLAVALLDIYPREIKQMSSQRLTRRRASQCIYNSSKGTTA